MDKILEAFKKSRESDDLMTPHNCNAAYIASDMGVDIEEEHNFQEELHGIVDKMQEDLVHETKILEGTLDPQYDPNEFPQNELSKSNSEDKQWMTGLLNGFSITDLTPISSDESSISFSTASSLNQARVIHDSDEMSIEQSSPSCPVIWADCGTEIERLSEQSDCMVQTISVPVLGTPSEEK